MFKLTDIAVILFITTLVNIVATSVSWQKRRSNYGWYFATGMIGITLWTLAAGLDYAAVPIPLKVFFAKLEYLGYQSALALFAVSMILYAGHEEWLKKTWVKFFFIAIPASNILLAWTNDWHRWLWSGFIVSATGNNVVDFLHGPAFIWTIFTGYLLIAIMAANLLQVAFTGADLIRRQARLLFIMMMIPVAGNLLYLFDAFRTPGVDWSSITFSIACLLFLGALYGLRFMEIIPIARNTLVEKMPEGILVLDSRGTLVDFNPAAQAIFGFGRETLGKSFPIALECCPEIVALLEDSSGKELQKTGVRYGENFFDVHMTRLADQRGGIYGKLVVLKNISERHRGEETLRKSEERYQTFLSQSFEAIYRTEFDQPIDISLPVETQIDLIYANAYMAECNQAMADMYNFSSTDALIGARLLDAHGSSDNPINRAAFRKFIEGGYKSTNDETLERDAQGNPVWFLSNTLGIVENGLLVRMWGTSINITERKRAEETLRRREKEFKTLVENSPDAITRFDREGHYQYVNPARAWYFGRTVDEIQGKTWQDLLGPDEVEEGKIADAALKQIFENPKDFTVEYQTKTPDGMRWVQSRGTPEFAEDGSVESVLVVTRDITERKQAEEELRRSEMLLREIAANYPHSFISVIEKDLTVGFTAGQEFRRLNLNPDSFVGLTLEQVFGEHTPLVRENYLKTFGGTESEFELYINNQHQLYRTVPLMNRDGKIDRILSVVENVTERKQMEETLARLASFPELNPQPVVELGLDGNITYLNPAARRVFPDLQDRGKDHPWLSGLEKISEGFLQGAIPANTRELQCGELIYEQTINYVPEYKRVRVYGRDITDRKQMEDALTQSEALFREVFDNIANGVFVIDVTKDGNFRIENSNKAEEILTTVRREDVMGKLLAEAFPSDIAQALHTNYSRCLEAGESIAYEEEVKLQGVGQRFYFTTLAPVRNESGRFYRIIGSTLEITERKQMENALLKSEEEHRLIVQAAMDGFWQLDMQGHIIQVNNAYCQMSGYSEQELRFMKISDLEVVETPEITAAHMQKVIAQGQDRFETRHRREDGSIFDVEISVQYREGRLFAFLRDITESRRAEEILRLRVRLWEYSATHSIDELLQMTLDEIGILTDSPIGFYHFVEQDQKTLSLQAWSTRTTAEYCKAEGKGMHYSIDEAGVWVDCVRERKPVIHNDYASLPHRKGLPTGHAALVRELVVPTMRNDQLVAILGVGNKYTNYDEKDINLVSNIADIIWTIVEQKRADEQIRQLNAKLEQLAMTDELTGLFNRRSFFRRGTAEIRRCQRYHTPLSLLMMDIDHFKKVNDTYGHDVGDQMLCCIADALRCNIRSIDIVARLGGEEFGVLLPNTEAKDAFGLAERLRQAAEQTACSNENRLGGITLSIGVALYDNKEMENLDHLLKKADTAMYVAKNQGRNRVVMFG